MDCVESAAKLGAGDVYLVYRRSYAQMPAEPDERKEAQEAGVHFLLLNQPVGYVAGRGRRLKGLKLVRTRLGAADASGRRSPKPVRGSEWVLDCDAVIEAIGNRPAADSPNWYPRVKLAGDNLIKVNPRTGRTSVRGIFAGGDIVRGPGLVVQAVADGKTAAWAIRRYLNG
jgi:NADPH-dependent glutamate synthase beta subunit-like oxidoreductase